MALRISIFPPLKRLKKYGILFLIIVLIKIPWVIMMAENGEEVLSGRSKAEIFARRSFLVDRVQVRELGLKQMPTYLGSQFQGEWAIATYSMLTAALTNIAFKFPETRDDSLMIVDKLIERVKALELRLFDSNRWGEDPLDSLSGNNGHIGYLGHLNWMLGAHYFLGGDSRYDELFPSVTEALYRRLKASPAFCSETYPQEIYIPDNVVVFASIANYSLMFDGKYKDLHESWVKHARNKLLDRSTGLLPFYLNHNCEAIEGVRGSGAGWNSYYLPYIDQTFATEQFENLKQHLLQTRLITGVREYPKGVFGLGDVDSGPVLLGFSPSGTGFAVGGAAHTNDADLLSKLLFTSEVVGSSLEWGGRRSYLLAPLVGEAIMLAMKTANVWDLRFARKNAVNVLQRFVQ